MKFCPHCNISLEDTWEICPTCSQALTARTIKKAGGIEENNFRIECISNLPYSCNNSLIAIIIAIILLKIVRPLCLIFPPYLILGGLLDY